MNHLQMQDFNMRKKSKKSKKKCIPVHVSPNFPIYVPPEPDKMQLYKDLFDINNKKQEELIEKLRAAATLISKTSRHGAANWIIVKPK